MKIEDILGTADNFGPIGFHDKEAPELRNAICVLAKHYKDMELRYFAGTMKFRESMSKTEWVISDNSDGVMRWVCIAKRVTRLIGTPHESVKTENVMVVDREIAESVLELLNSQPEPNF